MCTHQWEIYFTAPCKVSHITNFYLKNSTHWRKNTKQTSQFVTECIKIPKDLLSNQLKQCVLFYFEHHITVYISTYLLVTVFTIWHRVIAKKIKELTIKPQTNRHFFHKPGTFVVQFDVKSTYDILCLLICL